MSQDPCVYSVTIQLNLISAQAQMKFPCTLFAQWYTNRSSTIQTQRYPHQAGKVTINQTLSMKTEIVYDRIQKIYQKKDSTLQLSLISKTNPNQPKLVGRLTIDLASIMNQKLYAKTTTIPLQFSSVNAQITISAKITDQIQSDLTVIQFDKSQNQIVSSRLANISAVKQKTYELHRRTDSRSNLTQNSMKKQAGSTLAYENKESSSIIKTNSVIKETRFQQTPESQKKIAATHQRKYSTKQYQPQKNGSKSVIINQNVPGQSEQILKPQMKTSTYIAKKAPSVRSQSMRSGQFKVQSQQFSKNKIQLEHLKGQNERNKQDAQRYRKDLDSTKKQNQLLKLQIKQKNASLQSTNKDNLLMRNESAKLKDELGKGRQDSVGNTLKLAQLRQANNKLSIQINASERQVRRLQGLGQQLKQSEDSKKQINQQLKETQAQLLQMKGKFEAAQKEKLSLKQMIGQKNNQNTEALAQCSSLQKNYGELKNNMQMQVRVLRQQLKQETKQKIDSQSTITQLNSKIDILLANIKELEASKTASTKEIQSLKKTLKSQETRVKELQEALISLNQRLSNLQIQNSTNYAQLQQKIQAYNTLQTQKSKQINDYIQAIRTLQQTVLTLNAIITTNQQQKISFQQKITYNNQQIQLLVRQIDTARQDGLNQADIILDLQNNIGQQQLKIQKCQELLIKVNEQRDQQRQQAGQKEIALTVRVAQLQTACNTLGDSIGLSTRQKLQLENQLRNRQNLIQKLQSGLKLQISQKQYSNTKIMNYFIKQQQYKILVLQLQQQIARLNGAVEEQHQRDNMTGEILKGKDNMIEELYFNLQASVNYGKQLESTIQSQHQIKQNQFNSFNQQLLKAQTAIQERNHIISELQQRTTEMNEHIEQYQAQILGSKEEIQFLVKKIEQLTEESKGQTGKVLEAAKQIENKENLLINLHEQLEIKENQLNGLRGELTRKEQEYSENMQILTKKNQEQAKRLDKFQAQAKGRDQLYVAQIQQLNDALSAINIQLTTLREKHNALVQQMAAFDINNHKEELTQKTSKIQQLQKQLQAANSEIQRISTLERNLKIKTIELNSIKYGKEESQPQTQQEQLVRLKNQQIQSLKSENAQLMRVVEQSEPLSEKVAALQQQLQLIQQQKFNIQSLSNQRVYMIQELRNQNKNLVQEIATIGQRNSQLQKIMQEFVNRQSQNLNQQTNSGNIFKAQRQQLKAQIQQLKTNVKTVQQFNRRLQQEIDRKEDQHVVALLDQQIKYSENQQNNHNYQSKSLGNVQIPMDLKEVYQNIKKVIAERRQDQTQVKLIDMLDQYLSQESNVNLMNQQLRILSKQFQKLKSDLLRTPRVPQQKLKLMDICKKYEIVIDQVLLVSVKM